MSAAEHILRFRPAPDDDGYGYWRALSGLWLEDTTIVNVEWDVEYDLELVDELLDCPHPVCTHAYRCYPGASTRLAFPIWAHQVSTAGLTPPIEVMSQWSARGFRWLNHGEEWADFSGIGFIKITPEGHSGDLRRETWRGVELSVAASLTSRIHVHWPGVEHYHKD